MATTKIFHHRTRYQASTKNTSTTWRWAGACRLPPARWCVRKATTGHAGFLTCIIHAMNAPRCCLALARIWAESISVTCCHHANHRINISRNDMRERNRKYVFMISKMHSQDRVHTSCPLSAVSSKHVVPLAPFQARNLRSEHAPRDAQVGNSQAHLAQNQHHGQVSR